MSRPKKATVDYFPHSCNHKQTMFIIEQRFGNDGYAFWFKLLEMLGSTEGHYLDLNETETWEFLQAKTHLAGDICKSILELLSKLKAIDPDLWEKQVVWSDNFIAGISRVYANRRIEIPTKPDNYTEKPEPVGTPTREKPQSIVKNSKAKKPPLPPFVNKKIWNEYIEMRRKIRAPMTEPAEKLTLKKLEEFKKQGEDPNEILQQSIMKSWRGVFPVKDKKGFTQEEKLPKFNEDTHFLCRYCGKPKPKEEREYGERGEGCRACLRAEREQGEKQARENWEKSSPEARKKIIESYKRANLIIPEWMREAIG